jgi:ssDNA-binding Zn-finger/Zn-ribbon topoisomerase 1
MKGVTNLKETCRTCGMNLVRVTFLSGKFVICPNAFAGYGAHKKVPSQ